MTRRRRAREIALQVLFEEDLNPQSSLEESDAFLQRRLRSPELREFSRSLVEGVRQYRGELDKRIENTAANWSLSRMAATDRNVLRLGAYEMLYGGTPDRVAVNEAIELARRYGSAQSPQFVNGILDRLMHEQGSGVSVQGSGFGVQGSEDGS